MHYLSLDCYKKLGTASELIAMSRLVYIRTTSGTGRANSKRHLFKNGKISRNYLNKLSSVVLKHHRFIQMNGLIIVFSIQFGFNF